MSNSQKSPAPDLPSPEATTASTPTKAAAPATAKSAPASAKKVAPARKRPAPSAAKSATALVAAKPATTTKAPAPAPARKRVAAKKAPAASVVKKVKQKLVRDSFTMPSADFALIDQLKTRAIGFKRPAKKSELLRAGLKALSALSDAKLKSVLDGLTPLKAGRPKKNDA